MLQKLIFMLSIALLTNVFATKHLEVWIMPNGASPQEKLEKELAFFTKETGIQTQVVVLDWGEAWNRISTALSTGKDLPAVVQLGSTWLPYFASRDELLSLNSNLNKIQPDRFVPVSFETTHIEGDSNIYAVPWFIDARALLANQKILNELNLEAKDIRNYPRFIQSLRKIKKANLKLNDGTPIQPYAFPGRNDWNIPHNFAPWIWSNGGDFISKDSIAYRSNLLSESTIKGIARYLYFVLDTLVDPQNLTLNTAQISQQFNNGEIAFILNTSETIMQTRYKTEEGGLLNSRIGQDGVLSFPVPIGEKGSICFIGGSHLAIPAKFSDKSKAMQLLLFLTQDEFLNSYNQHIGFLPPSKKVLEEWKKVPIYNVLVNSLNNGKAYPSITEWSKIEEILGNMFSSIWALMEIPELYSSQKIYHILLQGDSLINAALERESMETVSFEEFNSFWNLAIEEIESISKTKTVDNPQEKTPLKKHLSVGIFFLMLFFGFLYAYSKKRRLKDN